MSQKMYLIDWIDTATTSGWQDKSLASCCQNQSVGFYVKEDKISMTIALSKAEEGFIPYGDYITIPKVCIKKKKQVK